jgi:hypothetical protein
MVYLNCQYCVEEGVRGPYDIVVTDAGDLQLICRAHELNAGGPYLTLKNDVVAEELRKIALVGCDRCDHDGEATKH